MFFELPMTTNLFFLKPHLNLMLHWNIFWNKARKWPTLLWRVISFCYCLVWKRLDWHNIVQPKINATTMHCRQNTLSGTILHIITLNFVRKYVLYCIYCIVYMYCIYVYCIYMVHVNSKLFNAVQIWCCQPVNPQLGNVSEE